MKKLSGLFYLCFIYNYICHGQDDPDAVGYRLKIPSKVVLKVYQEQKRVPKSRNLEPMGL